MEPVSNTSIDVTVVVLARNGPEGFARAIESVMSQSGIEQESIDLLVIDLGGVGPVPVSVPGDLQLSTIRLEHSTTGAARAAGLVAAKGEFISWCDDDAAWHPHHLAALLSALRANTDAAFAYGDSMAVPPVSEPAPVATGEGNKFTATTYIRASDVLHRASAARAVGGFDPNLDAFEDWDLWLRLGRAFHAVQTEEVLTTHFLPDSGGTSEGAEHAQRRIVEDQRWWSSRVHKDGLVRNRAKPMRFDPRTWAPQRRRLLVQASLRENLSFGVVGRNLLLALEAQGVDCIVGPLREQPPAGFERFYGPVPPRSCLAFHNDYSVGPGAVGCERLVYYWMHESTLVPADRIIEINQYVSVLLVPCQQNKDAFEACGVKVPVHILHHGVDASLFPYLERPERDWFTFGTFGDLTVRKGIDVLVRAFTREFAPHEPVRLLIKRSSASRELPGLDAPDPRIEVRSEFLDRPGLLAFLSELDAFVLPSRGEGFGLCGLEAMATGLPTVATNWGGPAEYLDPADSLPLNYRLQEANGAWALGTRFFGHWAEPDEQHLRMLLRWLFDHPRQAAELGRASARRVHADFSWNRAASELVAVFNRLASE
jgi:glycosyltransferase involved in cell wall biosynthesis